jgi:hypothetical protein
MRASIFDGMLLRRMSLAATQSEIKTIIQQWQQGVRERFDCCFRTQDGSQLWAIVSTTPILTPNGEFNVAKQITPQPRILKG